MSKTTVIALLQSDADIRERWQCRGATPNESFLQAPDRLRLALSAKHAGVTLTGAVAPLRAEFEGLRGDDEYWWCCADIITMSAGMRDVSLDNPEPAVHDDERAALSQLMAGLLAQSDLEYVGSADNRGYLRTKSARALEAIDPLLCVGRNLYAHMPQGRDGGEFRQLMTECQMLLHDHPINNERGAPPLNTFWFWGAGRALPASIPGLPRLHSDDTVLRAYWALSGDSGLTSSNFDLRSIAGTAPVCIVGPLDVEQQAALNGLWLSRKIADVYCLYPSGAVLHYPQRSWFRSIFR